MNFVCVCACACVCACRRVRICASVVVFYAFLSICVYLWTHVCVPMCACVCRCDYSDDAGSWSLHQSSNCTMWHTWLVSLSACAWERVCVSLSLCVCLSLSLSVCVSVSLSFSLALALSWHTLSLSLGFFLLVLLFRFFFFSLSLSRALSFDRRTNSHSLPRSLRNTLAAHTHLSLCVARWLTLCCVCLCVDGYVCMRGERMRARSHSRSRTLSLSLLFSLSLSLSLCVCVCARACSCRQARWYNPFMIPQIKATIRKYADMYAQVSYKTHTRTHTERERVCGGKEGVC